MGVTMIL